MGSRAKNRQTFAKIARERALKEKRELKQEKKDARKAAASLETEDDGTTEAPSADDLER